MKLGTDFWIVLRIIAAVIRALITCLGDQDDRDEFKANGF
jgi:hypothetical protein